MSKAFVKESESDDDDTDAKASASPLPAGTKNYITPSGFRRLQDELKHLSRTERPKVVEIVSWAAGNGDRSENGDYIYGKKRLREIDRRIRFLSKRLEIAEVVDPVRQAHLDRVFFGATVTFEKAGEKAGENAGENAGGEEHTVTIVGVDEADSSRGRVSWVSPVARALMKAQEGDVVALKSPAGVEEIEIVRIRYDNGAG